MPRLPRSSNPLPSTSDFTLDEIVSVEPDGYEDVYDIEVDRTHNFIANRIVSSNTRWHDDDLSGRVERVMNEGLREFDEMRAHARTLMADAKTPQQKEEGQAAWASAMAFSASVDNWEIVKYPALATHDEYLNLVTGKIATVEDNTELLKADAQNISQKLLRKKGQALHPDRFPVPLLQKYKRTLQPRHWSALYQQNPTPDEGMFFTKDMFRFRPTLPDWREMYRFVAWDLAIGLRNTNDYTVGIVGALDWEDNLWILDMLRGRWQTHHIAQNIVDTHVRYGAVQTGIEKGQLELAIMPSIQRIMKERNTYITLAEGSEALKPITDKVVRARPLQGRMQQGKVILPADQPWVDTLLAEMLRFPTGTHDDIVDSLSWMARMVMQQQPPARPSLGAQALPQGFKSWRDRLRGMIDEPKPFMAR